MSIRRCVADFRSPPRWTKADRSRECERAIVSIAWPRSPFGMRDVLVMPNVQPGVWRASGLPVLTENLYMQRWGTLVDANNWHLTTGDAGEELPAEIWGSGAQSLTAVDLTRVGGTAIDGTWTGTLVVPRWASNAIYRITHVFLLDAGDHNASYTPSSAGWGAWTTPFPVTSVPDPTAPPPLALSTPPRTPTPPPQAKKPPFSPSPTAPPPRGGAPPT